MKYGILTGAALLLSVSSAALAQTSPAPTGMQAKNPSASADEKRPDTASLHQQLMTNLQQAGFTDVKIVPESFLVQAKDKSGNAVTMFLSPDSMAEITTASLSNSNGAQAGSPANKGGTFAEIQPNGELSSKVIGVSIYNGAKQEIGTIKDVAFNGRGVQAYIVGVGGFLGMGDHYVAVRPSAVHLTYDHTSDKWSATMDTNADQLKAAPEYKYPTKS